MPETYNNVPMSDEAAAKVARSDRFWTGPKFIILSFATLGAAFALLWACAEGIIGPTMHEVDWGQETHFLQSGLDARPWD